MKKYKPNTPGRRGMTSLDFAEITTDTPEKSLVETLKKNGGRNNTGRITVRHRGGGHARKYRIIDFKRTKDNVPATVATIEYDPNRSSNIALLHYADGEKRYIIAPQNLEVGQVLLSGSKVEPEVGNAMEMRNIPVGYTIHAVETEPGKGASLARSAGSWAKLSAKDEDGTWVQVTLPSGAVRRISGLARATVGTVGNKDYSLVKQGKAGRNRWRGWRPTVRGTAQNPVDHPMGGGEDRNSGGHPCSPTGIYAKGGRTRKAKSLTNTFVVRHRRGRS